MTGTCHSDEQLAEFRGLYRQRRSRRVYVLMIMGLLIFALILAVMISGDRHVLLKEFVYLPALIILLCVGLIQNYRYTKCPACGEGMGDMWDMRYCPKCGVQLVE